MAGATGLLQVNCTLLMLSAKTVKTSGIVGLGETQWDA